MGSICSKGPRGVNNPPEVEKAKDSSKPSATPPALPKQEEVVVEVFGGGIDGSVGKGLKPAAQQNISKVAVSKNEKGNQKKSMGTPPKVHQRESSTEMVVRAQSPMSRLLSLPHGAEGEQIVAGWPPWLSSVAGEAIKGWVPRRADSFEKLDKIGQGTYSSVYKARDLNTGKIVAMKKVRFVNMDPESVRFMAREIYILRQLDHPNVMKLEGLVTSKLSNSLYLVFEYMEHDLAGLAATRGAKFTEPQIKCYMQQLLRGLEHCHSRGVLHRDIKGSNLLIDNNGVLKVGDFGLATLFQPGESQSLTSRVVTLWYRAPELLLGATEYGVAIDLWSTGCILAELFAGKPIMPGRTEVEQMHKIFKLCGSPSEEYWKKSKLPHATSFKPQHPYKRCLNEMFKDFPSSAFALVDKLLAIEPEDRGSASLSLKSEFFSTEPLPCDPLSIPKYPPSKEFDAKLRDEARRERAVAVIGRGPESVRRGSSGTERVATPEFNAQGKGQPNLRSSNINYNGSGFPIELPKEAVQGGLSHSTSMMHPKATQSHSTNKASKDVNTGLRRAPSRKNAELKTQKSCKSQRTADVSKSKRKDEILSGRDSAMGYKPKKNIMHYSGPLMPPGGNIDDMLKEHERQIQQAVRKARRQGHELGKPR